MGSLLIHLTVASEVNKMLHRDNNSILIGSIAPDIAKLIGDDKKYSHFYNEYEMPDLNMFLLKYGNRFDDDFVVGYFIHLCTDYLWKKYFMPVVTNKKMIYKLDGSMVKYTENLYKKYIYSDYTNLNIQLIDEYNLDLDVFYSPKPKFENIIEEIPMEKLEKVINESANILKNTKENHPYLFKLDDIKDFIKMNVDFILSTLHDYYQD